MDNPNTARARARAELTAQIMASARKQVAEHGAAALSLRAVTRDLDMVSSSIYRYFASRDELLTALITESFTNLAAALTRAVRTKPSADLRGRWMVAFRAMRRWAHEHPHEFTLIYGSPVPGYAAPESTIAPAGEVAAVYLDILSEAGRRGVLAPTVSTPAKTERQFAQAAQNLGLPLSPGVLAAAYLAFGQLIGIIALELNGHFVGSLASTEQLIDLGANTAADQLGLG